MLAEHLGLEMSTLQSRLLDVIKTAKTVGFLILALLSEGDDKDQCAQRDSMFLPGQLDEVLTAPICTMVFQLRRPVLCQNLAHRYPLGTD